MVEAVAPEIAVLPQVEIQLGILWQPELRFALGKSHWSILHSLMLAAQLNFLDRIRQVRLQANNLESVRRDPRSSFEADRIISAVDDVILNLARLVLSLLKMDQPCGFLIPGAQTFAAHVEIVAHVRVKDQSHSRQATSSNVVGEGSNVGAPTAKLIDLEAAGLRLCNRGNIVEPDGAMFLQNSHWINFFVVNVFHGVELG